MKKSLLAGAVLAGSLACGPALVQAENSTGWYVGGGFGQFNLDINSLDDFGSGVQSAVDDNDNSWKLFLGWRILPFLAVEAAYVNLGKPSDRIYASGSDGRYTVKADGFAPSVLGILPLGPFEVFGKVGYYYYDAEVRTHFGQGSGQELITGSHSRNDFTYGAGIGITFLEHLNVRAEWERFDLENFDDSDAVWLSAAWRF